MTIQEITETEWLERGGLAATEPVAMPAREALFFYTSMCGTCKLAEKMLEISIAAGPVISISKLNINFSPLLRDLWKISSVPCLIVLENGKPVQVEYAMRSVVDLYQWLRVG